MTEPMSDKSSPLLVTLSMGLETTPASGRCDQAGPGWGCRTRAGDNRRRYKGGGAGGPGKPDTALTWSVARGAGAG